SPSQFGLCHCGAPKEGSASNSCRTPIVLCQACVEPFTLAPPGSCGTLVKALREFRAKPSIKQRLTTKGGDRGNGS
ncbi:hypothetical protein Ancab_015649, partial [Ancistrocladus abbreviatus]